MVETMDIGPQHGFKAHRRHIVAHIKAHVHVRNVLKTKMLVAGLVGLKLMITHSIVWLWLAAKFVVVKKLFLMGLFSLIALAE